MTAPSDPCIPGLLSFWGGGGAGTVVGGGGGRQAAGSDAVVLGTIADLAASVASATSVTLTWSDVAGGTSYQPQYRTTAGGGSYTNFGSAIGTGVETVTVTGLTEDTEYDFRVVASDGSTTTNSNVVAETPVATIFSSDWGTATGTGTSAIRDTGGDGWDSEACSSPLLEVLASGSVPTPAPPTGISRVLRCEYTDNGDCRNVVANLNEYGLARGQSYYLRWYYRIDTSGPSRASHYDTIDVFGYRNCAIHTPDTRADDYRFVFRNEWVSYPYQFWTIGPDITGALALATWYRIEAFIDILANENDDAAPTAPNSPAEWEHANQVEFRIYFRIYEGNGTTAIRDTSDFAQDDYGSQGSDSLQSWYDAGNAFLTAANITSQGLSGGTADALDDFLRVGIGNNGATGGNAPEVDGSQYYYYAEFAASTTDWIGAI